MALMHPEEIEEFKNPTEGEQKVFRFLRETARPDKEFIGWYEPAIGEQGLEPDFVLFGKWKGSDPGKMDQKSFRKNDR